MTFLFCSHLISRDGEQIQPIHHGRLGSAPSGIHDLVRESRLRRNRRRPRYGHPPVRSQPRHADTTVPAREAPAPIRAGSAHGATRSGSPCHPHMGRGKRVAVRRRDGGRRHLTITDCGNGSPCLPHMGRGWRVVARRRGGGRHRFTATDCSDGALRGGRDRDVAPSLRDAHPRCDPHFIRQHQREWARGSTGLSPHLDPRPRGTTT